MTYAKSAILSLKSKERVNGGKASELSEKR